MKVLMFGWEFPPFISGGLGTACYGLTRAMTALGAEVVFVLPHAVEASHSSHVTLLTPEGPVVPETADSTQPIRILAEPPDSAYARPAGPKEPPAQTRRPRRAPSSVKPGSVMRSHYGGDLFSEVDRYAAMACEIIEGYDFDVIHAHDWLTYRAGQVVAARTGRPFIVHVHSTEFDRSGEHVNQRIYDIEREGMEKANHVIAVSRLTKDIIVRRYEIPPEKVTVVYNAIDTNGFQPPDEPVRLFGTERVVLFMGRITMQKGPEYFVAAARRVLERMPDVRFVIAGSGDLAGPIVEMVAREGLGRRIVFTGFLRGADVERVFRAADLFVMPSVSEPFGLVPLEALAHGVPVIISKQSGVAEILRSAPKVDFWDTHRLADLILAILERPGLHAFLRRQGMIELSHLRWENSARDCLALYDRLVRAASGP